MRNRFSIIARGIPITLIVMLLGSIVYAQAREEVLHSFNQSNGDGYQPLAGFVADAEGNLYGTTYSGGTNAAGTVFELTPKLTGSVEKVLYSFGAGSTDGSNPSAGLIFDAAGNLYGTTNNGGAYGYGTAFELTPNGDGSWTETILHSFNKNGTDGFEPTGGLVLDAAGNLYGTTAQGGISGFCGTVFELSPQTGGSWSEAVLYSFKYNSKDACRPIAGLTFDSAGNLYGTTIFGGSYNYGTVFGMRRTAGGGWQEGVLHSFNDSNQDGYVPYGGVILDAEGNIYGTTNGGGAGSWGTVFELQPKPGGGWQEGVLHSFGTRSTDGNSPYSGLTFDAAGNLYGTTNGTGIPPNDTGGGTVFELSPKSGGWQESVLYSFPICDNGSQNGCGPRAGVIFDAAGNLFSTTQYGGTDGGGTVFGLKP